MLTNRGMYDFNIELEDFEGQRRFAKCNGSFWVRYCRFRIILRLGCTCYPFILPACFCNISHYRPSRHGQTTDPVQLKLCLSHKRRLASNADVGFYCVNFMTTSFSSPERIVWTIMSGIITVTRLMSSLGLKITGLNEFIFDSFIRFTQKGHGEITCIFISLQKTQDFKSWPWHLF